MKKQKKKAFTLVEMMVAIAVIGTIAALTIPTFFADSTLQKSQYTSGLEKVYSELSFATDQIKCGNSGIFTKAWTTTGNANDNLRNLYLGYPKITGSSLCDPATSKTSCTGGLKVTQLCNAGTSQTNCWPANYYKFDGSANGLDLSTYSMAVLNDGSFLTFHSLSVTCTDATVKDASLNSIGCGEIYIDINGFKAPNRFGKDIFLLYITPYKIIPNGDSGTPGTNCPSNGGLECAAKVLNDGKMLY